MSGVEVLAQVMREYDKVGEFWDAYYRDAAERILADPGPLLAALAEAGVLEVRYGARDVSGEVYGWEDDQAVVAEEWAGPLMRCYVTEWREA